MHVQVAKTISGGLDPLTFKEPVDRDSGQPFRPVSATLTVTTSADETFSAAGVFTVDGDAGTVQYDWTVSELATLTASLPALSCHAKWQITDDAAKVHDVHQWFDVVSVGLLTGVVDSDVVRCFRSLREWRRQEQGRVGSATVSTIIDTNNRNEPSGYWENSRIRMLTGNLSGQSRIVSQFDGVDSELFLVTAFGSVPGVDSEYQLEESYQPEINTSYGELVQGLVAQYGRDRVARVLDGGDLRQAHLFLAVSHACLSVAPLTGNAFDSFIGAANHYRAQSTTALANAGIKMERQGKETDGEYDPATDDNLQPLTHWGT